MQRAGKVRFPHVLSVAGSDPGAGAGIQADLKACAGRGVYCFAVITAVTEQNTAGVQGVNIVPEEFVEEQLKSVISDIRPDVERVIARITWIFLAVAILVLGVSKLSLAELFVAFLPSLFSFF